MASIELGGVVNVNLHLEHLGHARSRLASKRSSSSSRSCFSRFSSSAWAFSSLSIASVLFEPLPWFFSYRVPAWLAPGRARLFSLGRAGAFGGGGGPPPPSPSPPIPSFPMPPMPSCRLCRPCPSHPCPLPSAHAILAHAVFFPHVIFFAHAILAVFFAHVIFFAHAVLPPFPSLPIPSLPFPSLPIPSLPFPSLPIPSLPFPSLPIPSWPAGLPCLRISSRVYRCSWRLGLVFGGFSDCPCPIRLGGRPWFADEALQFGERSRVSFSSDGPFHRRC